MLILIMLFDKIQFHLIMYKIKDNDDTQHEYYDCLLYYVSDDNIIHDLEIPYIRQHQTIPFCIRPLNNSVNLHFTI